MFAFSIWETIFFRSLPNDWHVNPCKVSINICYNPDLQFYKLLICNDFEFRFIPPYFREKVQIKDCFSFEISNEKRTHFNSTFNVPVSRYQTSLSYCLFRIARIAIVVCSSIMWKSFMYLTGYGVYNITFI